MIAPCTLKNNFLAVIFGIYYVRLKNPYFKHSYTGGTCDSPIFLSILIKSEVLEATLKYWFYIMVHTGPLVWSSQTTLVIVLKYSLMKLKYFRSTKKSVRQNEIFGNYVFKNCWCSEIYFVLRVSVYDHWFSFVMTSSQVSHGPTLCDAETTDVC